MKNICGINMKNTLFLAKCNDKTHRLDFELVDKLKETPGIEKASVTHVNFGGSEYCIAVNVSTRNATELALIEKKISDQPHIVEVIQLA